MQLVKELLTINQLAQRSGLSVSTLRRRVKDGSLPAIQPGGAGKKMLFLPTVLDALSTPRVVDAHTVTGEKSHRSGSESAATVPDYGSSCASQSDGSAVSALSGDMHGSNHVRQRAYSGRLPTWMRSPLFKNQTKSES
jgi:excisionase family DNA binding protein